MILVDINLLAAEPCDICSRDGDAEFAHAWPEGETTVTGAASTGSQSPRPAEAGGKEVVMHNGLTRSPDVDLRNPAREVLVERN